MRIAAAGHAISFSDTKLPPNQADVIKHDIVTLACPYWLNELNTVQNSITHQTVYLIVREPRHARYLGGMFANHGRLAH